MFKKRVCINKTLITSIFLALSFNSHAVVTYTDSTRFNFDDVIHVKHNVGNKVVGGNPQVSVKYGNWTSWETSSHMVNCSQWQPSAEGILWGKLFIQTQICEAEETRYRDVTYTYQNGEKRVQREYETAVGKVDDEQDAIGKKDYIVSTLNKEGSWRDKGLPHSCSSWSPSTGSVSKGVAFTQKQSCLQDQERLINRYSVWASGVQILISSDNDYRTLTKTNSKAATGTKQDAKWRMIFSGSRDFLNLSIPAEAQKIRTKIGNDVEEHNTNNTIENKKYTYREDNYGMGDECEVRAIADGFLSYSPQTRILKFLGESVAEECDPDGYAEATIRIYNVYAYY